MSISALLKLIPFASSIVKAWRETVAFFAGRAQRQAGRNEAILEQKEATDAVITDALEARRDQQRINADPDSLRAPDKYSRD